VTGKIDLIAAGMSPTAERAKRVLFTQPHYQGKGLVVIANSNIKEVSKLGDLSGYTVAVNEGYTTESILEGVDGVTLLRLGTPTEALMALKAGHVDAFLIADSAAQPLLKANKEYAVYKIMHNQEHVAFALKNPELLEKLNAVLESMEMDGTLLKITIKWGL
jgi:polar amino acid transport system substrate-binding protein